MGAASFPILEKLRIVGTDLVKSSKGDPPLLKQFLSERIGINVQRKEQKATKHGRKFSMISSVKIDDSIPEAKKSTVDERITNYRAEMALEAHKKQAIEGILLIYIIRFQLSELKKSRNYRQCNSQTGKHRI